VAILEAVGTCIEICRILPLISAVATLSLFRHTGTDPNYAYANYSGFCYALAKNGLSFALGTDERDGVHFIPEKDTWPRTTQLIKLNEKADLVGASWTLMLALPPVLTMVLVST